MMPSETFFMGRGTPPRLPAKRGFTIMELVVVVAIVFVLSATASPVIATLFRDMRLSAAMGRVRAGLLQTRLLLLDQMRGNVPALTAPYTPSHFAGTALVFRWAPAKGEYDIFYAVNTSAAANATGQNLTSLTPALLGYARFDALEPMTLGTGLRAAGVRRNNATANSSHLELVPDSFAVCINPLGMVIPPDQKIYVNIQEAPTGTAPGLWNEWDTRDYDATAYDEETGVGGEGFATSLPLVIVYRDDDLPHDEAGPNLYRNADGTLNAALDPNELIRITKGRIGMLTIQGGSPLEF